MGQQNNDHVAKSRPQGKTVLTDQISILLQNLTNWSISFFAKNYIIEICVVLNSQFLPFHQIYIKELVQNYHN